MCAVDECGVCQGSSDCPLLLTLALDYPYVSNQLYVSGSVEQVAVEYEITSALSLRSAVPLDHFEVVSLQPANAVGDQIIAQFLITKGGYGVPPSSAIRFVLPSLMLLSG